MVATTRLEPIILMGPGILRSSRSVQCNNPALHDCFCRKFQWRCFQKATVIYNNLTIVRNYITGFSAVVDMGWGGGPFPPTYTNNTFTDNIFATDVAFISTLLNGNFTTTYTGTTNKWRRNILRVYPGDTRQSAADNGKFILPDGSRSTTDFAG